MQVYRRIEELPPGPGTAVTVGVFDGFHLGHQALVRQTIEAASKQGLRSCVLTFTNHPKALLSGQSLDLITSLEHRLTLLERAGVNITLAIEFTKEFASMTAEDFADNILRKRLGAKVLVLGPDARIGAGAHADASRMAELASAMGIQLIVVPRVLVGGEPVSSTRLRECIRAGDLAAAEAMLGRRVSVLGTVVPGDGRGRRLGFPTANLDVQREVRPPYGVYATIAILAGERIPSVTNVGFRPTFEVPSQLSVKRDRLIETHLLRMPSPFNAELYGRQMELEFVAKLRDERRFGTDSELAEQIARDIEAARRILVEGAR